MATADELHLQLGDWVIIDEIFLKSFFIPKTGTIINSDLIEGTGNKAVVLGREPNRTLVEYLEAVQWGPHLYNPGLCEYIYDNFECFRRYDVWKN